MRTIQKTISLESMTSRLPSIWPSYKNDKLYFFTDEELKKRNYQYSCNYGMIPMSIAFIGKTWDEVKENGFQLYGYGVDCNCDCSGLSIYEIGSSTSECDETFKMSFERLSKWYNFFTEYNHLLKDYGHCGRVYDNAVDYYNNEFNTKYVNEMVYGNDLRTYEEIDGEYEEMGGNEFYAWICDNVTPTYYISNDYKEYWKVDKLFYPDVVKWIAWFSKRLGYEETASHTDKTDIDVEHWDCKSENITNCCDCEEYFNRGGYREYKRMHDWYEALQSNISAISTAVRCNMKCYAATMDDKIELYNSLDNIGQFSVLASDYELGIDYRTASYGDTANTHGGTVASNDGKSIVLKDDKTGFCFSSAYMEKIYDETAWDDYTEKYMAENPSEFVSSSFKYYAYDEYDHIHTGNTPNSVQNSMSAVTAYSITDYDSILIDNILYPIQFTEYGTYDQTNKYLGGKRFFVYREKETSTPYTYVNGRKVYAELSEYSSDTNGNIIQVPCYYFSFFKKKKVDASVPFNINNYKQFPRIYKHDGNNNGNYLYYIEYNSVIHRVNPSDKYITINDIDYTRISGYTYDNEGEIMYIIGNKVYDNRLMGKIKLAKINVANHTVEMKTSITPIIYSAKEIEGHTISKLLSLKSTNCLVDDIGDKIDGLYVPREGQVNHQPPQGEPLDLLYQPRNVSDIVKMDDDRYYGNIITSMKFYYKDNEGNEITATTVTTTGDITSLSAITEATAKKANVDETIPFDESGIYCDVTYYMGATLSAETKESGGKIYDLDGNNYSTYGVEYNETVKFVKTNAEYYLKKPINGQIPTTRNTASAHTVSYPVCVYSLEQELTNVDSDVYGDYSAPLAKFKTEINLVDSSLNQNYNGSDIENELEVYPIFKQEYMMGVGSMENVDSDIYIERGINAAFEKHLKLGEVRSLEALENYSNGYFKIMDY